MISLQRNIWHHCCRPPWRTFLVIGAIVSVAAVAYTIWQPGADVRDGRHDLRTNGIWMQHGWLGADSWFKENGREPARFRSLEMLRPVADKFKKHGIRDLFPHLCPCSPDGAISAVDDEQVERFLDVFADYRVIPWIGGVHLTHCRPNLESWRRRFISSVLDLISHHPRLAGVQVNIEPMPSGDRSFLTFLKELKDALPTGKILSIAAYPPPTRWHPYPDIHWEESYFREVAECCDQLAVMTYDTAIRWEKPYQRLMADWTEEVISWAGQTPLLIGIPAYDDADSGYHHPQVENTANAITGMHAGLLRFPKLPSNYLGIALYSEWEMTEEEWLSVEELFGRQRP